MFIYALEAIYRMLGKLYKTNGGITYVNYVIISKY